MFNSLGLALIGLVLFTSQAAFSNELRGRVVGVTDGDTIDVLAVSNEVYRVRIAGIDCPEEGQPFGEAAKKQMSDYIFAKDVLVLWKKKDRFGRVIGRVEFGGRDVGLQLVRTGLAWHYKRFEIEQVPEDRKLYAVAELEARASKRGLWKEGGAIAPWDYRISRRTRASRD